MAAEQTRRQLWSVRVVWVLASVGLGFLVVGTGQLLSVIGPTDVPLLLVGGVLVVVGSTLVRAGAPESDEQDLTEWVG